MNPRHGDVSGSSVAVTPIWSEKRTMREYLDLPRSVHILCMGSFINRAGSFVLVFLTIYVSERLGFGKTFAAQCMGVFGLGSIAASLVGGQFADQVGRKTVMLVALFGGAAMLLLLSMATTRSGVLLTILVYAMIAESFRPACMAMLGDLTRPDQRPASFGLLYVSINLGFACGPPVGGLLADISYDLLFWGDAITMAIFGGIIWSLLDETGVTKTASEMSAADVPMRVAAGRIFADHSFLLFCLATLLISIVFMQSFSTLPIYIKDVGYTNLQFGLLMSLNGLMIVICQLPLTNLLTRFNAMTNILVGGILVGIGFAIYFLPPTLMILFASVAIWTTGEMMQAPFKQTLVTAMAPPELRGRYLGTHSMSYSLAMMIGAPLGGLILGQYGAQTLWIACMLVSVAAVGVYAASYRVLSKRIGAKTV